MSREENLIRQGKEIREGGFKEAYHSLPYKKMTEAKAEICRRCFWSNSVFNTKLSGKIAFRVYEIAMIESFFRTHNIDAWTGETLTTED